VTKSARLLAVSATLACCACAAIGQSTDGASSTSALIDVDRSCLSSKWHEFANGTTITVSADNKCGRPLTCDVRVGFATISGPDLYLECLDQHVRIGQTDTLCKWAGQPVAPGGSGSMRCK
jgi:hypothetical protein